MEKKNFILIISADSDFAQVMRFFLEGLNFRVEITCSAESGMEQALLGPEIILLDSLPPTTGGNELCRRLKQEDRTARIPIIMLVSRNKVAKEAGVLDPGVSGYIDKSLLPGEILARIRAVMWEESPAAASSSARERDMKIRELRRIIDEKSLRTFFQPIVTLSSRRPIGYEAFNYGPKGSPLESPLSLFALAAETNMYFELDTLCLSLAAKRATFIGRHNLLFLNTDPSIIDAEYFKNLEFLKGSSIGPEQLCIEITERTCVKNFRQLSSNLDYLKSLGGKVAIDDVGEGYSSLRAVVELKPEFIKADISLVRNVNSDDIKRSIIEVIIDLSRKLKRQVIAEGIETEEEYNTLLALGAEYGQGYLFARPSQQP